MATLNRAALHYEKLGDITNSLKAVYLLLEQIKQTNKAAVATSTEFMETADNNGDDDEEESKEEGGSGM